MEANMADISESTDSKEIELTKVEPVTRDSIRSQIFSTTYTTPKVVKYTFNGVELEFRQPSFEDFVEARQNARDNENFLIRMLIKHSFIPGTEERPFDEADYEALVHMPMSGNLMTALNTAQMIFDLKVEEKVKN
jgi:hypothetical protein